MQNPRVLAHGGAFSSPKVNYSKDTQDFVNLLMKEAHLSNTQRKGFAGILRSGESLPSNPAFTNEMLKHRFQMKRRAMCRQLGIDVPQSSHSGGGRRPRYFPRSGRRSLQQIVASGAYEPEPFRPTVLPPGNKEKEIARLQHQMAYGSEKPPESELINKSRSESARAANQEQDAKSIRFEELIDEIGDRIEFLNSMHEIGRDKVYRPTIEFQIREKLTELEQNYPREVKDVVKHFGLQKFMSRIEMPL